MSLRRDGSFRHPSEEEAWKLLKKYGFRLLCHNYHARFAEIDLVALSPEGVVHVIEIKSWKKAPLVHPLESLSEDRAQKMRDSYQLFLQDAKADERLASLDLAGRSVSFDLIWLRGDGTEWFREVF